MRQEVRPGCPDCTRRCFSRSVQLPLRCRGAARSWALIPGPPRRRRAASEPRLAPAAIRKEKKGTLLAVTARFDFGQRTAAVKEGTLFLISATMFAKVHSQADRSNFAEWFFDDIH